jgi:hypothetical protein
LSIFYFCVVIVGLIIGADHFGEFYHPGEYHPGKFYHPGEYHPGEFCLPVEQYVGCSLSRLVTGLPDALTISSSHHAV